LIGFVSEVSASETEKTPLVTTAETGEAITWPPTPPARKEIGTPELLTG
jgi:hypothetical protein